MGTPSASAPGGPLCLTRFRPQRPRLSLQRGLGKGWGASISTAGGRAGNPPVRGPVEHDPPAQGGEQASSPGLHLRLEEGVAACLWWKGKEGQSRQGPMQQPRSAKKAGHRSCRLPGVDSVGDEAGWSVLVLPALQHLGQRCYLSWWLGHSRRVPGYPSCIQEVYISFCMFFSS